MLAVSYIKALGTECSEENAGIYNRCDDTCLYCSTTHGSAAREKCCMKAQWARAAPTLHMHRFCATHACSVLNSEVSSVSFVNIC